MDKQFKKMYLLARELSLKKNKYISNGNDIFFKRLSVMDMVNIHHAFLKYNGVLNVDQDKLLTLLIWSVSLCDENKQRKYQFSTLIGLSTEQDLDAQYNGMVSTDAFMTVLVEYSNFSEIFNYVIIDKTKKNTKKYVDILANFRDKDETFEDNLLRIDNDVVLFSLEYQNLDLEQMFLCDYSLCFANLKMIGGVTRANQINMNLQNGFGMLAYLIERGNTLVGMQHAKSNQIRSALNKVKPDNYVQMFPQDIIYQLNNEIAAREGANEKLKQFNNLFYLRNENKEKYKSALPRLNDSVMETYKKILLVFNRDADWELVNNDYLEYKNGLNDG